jgi:predicted RNase H-like HicB family nuclease
MDGTPTGYYVVTLVEEVHPDGRSSWYAEHRDLHGCHAVGWTQDEALTNLERSREAWLLWAEEHDAAVPAPRENPEIIVQYSTRRDATQAQAMGADLGSENTIRVAV